MTDGCHGVAELLDSYGNVVETVTVHLHSRQATGISHGSLDFLDSIKRGLYT